MLGLGCGARSYTRAIHYCSEYAVGRAGVRELISQYVASYENEFDRVGYGFCLDGDEQRRRYVIQSLLSEEGLNLCDYRERFGSEAVEDLPLLDQLACQGLVAAVSQTLRLSEQGLEMSDQIGPALYSDKVRILMRDYILR